MLFRGFIKDLLGRYIKGIYIVRDIFFVEDGMLMRFNLKVIIFFIKVVY